MNTCPNGRKTRRAASWRAQQPSTAQPMCVVACASESWRAEGQNLLVSLPSEWAPALPYNWAQTESLHSRPCKKQWPRICVSELVTLQLGLCGNIRSLAPRCRSHTVGRYRWVPGNRSSFSSRIHDFGE